MADNTENRPVAIQVSGVKKMYKLGQIGGGTLQKDLQSWWARKRGREDPNSKIGEGERSHGDTFMALNGIDLTIYQGEAVGIIGSNGAGKSTLLKLLSRVTAPTEGEIDIYGRIASMLEVGTGFNPEMTGRENVYMNGAILGMTKQEIDAKMEQIIEFSEVREFIDTPVKRYSSGMFVKLAFSVAAHLDAEIMIMDEVLAVGDMAFQKKCLTKMREASKQDGRTVLYVSHNMDTIRRLCDRCIVLEKGKIIYEGKVKNAISYYSGDFNDVFPVYYDLNNAERQYDQYGSRIRITEFAFLGKEIAQYDRFEAMKFGIHFHSNEDIKGTKFGFVIVARSGEIIGLTQTMQVVADVIKGGDYYSELEVSFPELAEDEYYFYADIFSDDGMGGHWSYDHPNKPISFKIVDKHPCGLKWQIQYHGHTRLQEMKPVLVKKM